MDAILVRAASAGNLYWVRHMNQLRSRSVSLVALAFSAAVFSSACNDAQNSDHRGSVTAGTTGSSTTPSGGASNASSATGGLSRGGVNSGGVTSIAKGGAASGGNATGGTATSGTATGGDASGGNAAWGGASSGGATSASAGNLNAAGRAAVAGTAGANLAGSVARGGAGIGGGAGAAAVGGRSNGGGSGGNGGMPSAGKGGVPNTGGSGISSAGSSGSSGGLPNASGGYTGTSYANCFDFTTSTEKWSKTYAYVSLLTDWTTRDDAAATALLVNTVADWKGGNGYAGINGFVQLTIPFATSQSEYQGLYYAYPSDSSPLQLKDKTVHAFVKLLSGMTANDPSKPSGAKLVVKSGPDYFHGDGGWVNLFPGDWVELTIDVSYPNLDASGDPALYDPNDIRELGIEIDTSGSATAVEAPGVVMIDHVCY
jgi:hypothetical protein